MDGNFAAAKTKINYFVIAQKSFLRQVNKPCIKAQTTQCTHII